MVDSEGRVILPKADLIFDAYFDGKSNFKDWCAGGMAAMENFYSPVKLLGELENPDMARACKVSEPAKGIDTEDFTMTEQEFTQFVEQMRFNHDSVKRLWYGNARKEDMARRFRPQPVA